MTPMPRYVEPTMWHRSATHRMAWHTEALEDCAPCNRPPVELLTERVAIFARQVQHPDNQQDATLAELTHWYLMDRADIEAGRPLSYVPDL